MCVDCCTVATQSDDYIAYSSVYTAVRRRSHTTTPVTLTRSGMDADSLHLQIEINCSFLYIHAPHREISQKLHSHLPDKFWQLKEVTDILTKNELIWLLPCFAQAKNKQYAEKNSVIIVQANWTLLKAIKQVADDNYQQHECKHHLHSKLYQENHAWKLFASNILSEKGFAVCHDWF